MRIPVSSTRHESDGMAGSQFRCEHKLKYIDAMTWNTDITTCYVYQYIVLEAREPPINCVSKACANGPNIARKRRVNLSMRFSSIMHRWKA